MSVFFKDTHSEVALQPLKKVGIWEFGSLVHQINFL